MACSGIGAMAERTKVVVMEGALGTRYLGIFPNVFKLMCGPGGLTFLLAGKRRLAGIAHDTILHRRKESRSQFYIERFVLAQRGNSSRPCVVIGSAISASPVAFCPCWSLLVGLVSSFNRVFANFGRQCICSSNTKVCRYYS